jgi:hypothetical protein
MGPMVRDGIRAAQPWRRVAGALRSYWDDGQRAERVGYAAGGLLVASGLAHLVVYAVDGGPWEGPVSWRKAVTFGLSFGLTLISITWVAALLPLRARTRAWLLGVFTVACVTETAIVSLQVWRGVPSHFNMETALDATFARTLAAGGAALIAVLVTMTVLALRRGSGPPSLRLAVRVGLASIVGATVVGAVMIAGGVADVATGHQQEAYLHGGWLKPAHAALMHGVTVLPALAWLASFTGWDEPRRVQTVWLGATGYLLFAGVVTVATFAGSAPPAATALAAVGLGALAAAGILTLAAVRRGGPGPGIHRRT